MPRVLVAVTVSLLAASAACAAPQRAPALPPLVDEGEVHLYAMPFPHEADSLVFRLGAITAERDDGVEVPLQLRTPVIAGREVRDQRLLAWGRLPPGRYRGFRLAVRAATLATGDGSTELAVPPEPVRIPFELRVERRVARVVSLRFRPEESFEAGVRFSPRFSATTPPRTAPLRIVASADTAADHLTIAERGTNVVTDVVVTGRAPRGVALDAIASRAYVALSGDDEIEVVDLTAAEARRRVRLQIGDAPREVALTPDRGLLLSMNVRSRTVSFVETASLVESARVRVGEDPSGLVLDPAGRRAYVLNRKANTVSAVDVASRAVVATVGTDAEPIQAAVDRGGTRLYVVFAGSNYLTAFSLPDLAVAARVFVGLGATAVQFDGRTNLLYVAKSGERRVSVYDALSLLPVDDVPAEGVVTWMAIDEAENALLLLEPERRSLTVVDLTSRRARARLDVGAEPYSVAVIGGR